MRKSRYRLRPVTLLVSAALVIGIGLPTYSAHALVDYTRIAPPTASTIKNAASVEFKLQGVFVGMEKQQLIKQLGEPARKDSSEYGFEWYIYNQDYKQYLQVGVSDNKVVGLYTNSRDWKSASGIHAGSTKKEVAAAYGPSLTEIKKGRTVYKYNTSKGNYSLHQIGDVFATVFYDTHRQNTVFSIQLIAQDTELSFLGYYGKPSERLRSSFEQQVFDLTNAARVQNGKKPFVWNDTIASTARKHSADMAKRSFFDHRNPDGKSPFDRMKADGVGYKQAGENIAAGQASAILVYESWMNSKGHRDNILGDFARLGVGVAFGGKMNVYYTQNFYTPKS